MKIISFLLLAAALLFTACSERPGQAQNGASRQGASSGAAESAPASQISEPKHESFAGEYIDKLIAGMPLREQVAQLFIIRLGPEDSTEYASPGDHLAEYIKATTPGGFVLFASNISTADGTRELTEAIREHSPIPPFIAIDEEGGRISRLTAAEIEGYENPPAAAELGEAGDVAEAREAGEAIGGAIASLGFNLDFAPVADILTNNENTVIGDRSFGSDPEAAGDMAVAFQKGLRSKGILTSPKHFPGHGGAAEDSHLEPAVLEADDSQLTKAEYVPFQKLIEDGCEFVMLGHILAPNADDSGLPACLTPYFATEILRERMGFGGIIITDAMAMEAVAGTYSSGEAAVMALQAGVDMILMPEGYDPAVEGILEAVAKGEITEGRIQESLRRVLNTKIKAGLLELPAE